MSGKSIIKTGKKEYMRQTLAGRTFRAVMAMALALVMVAMVIGFSMYAQATLGQCVNIAYNVSGSAAAIVSTMADPASCADQVMARFHTLSEEVKQKKDDAYLYNFRYIQSDENYQRILSVLEYIMKNNNVEDVYMLAYDEESQRVVYIADPEQRQGLWCPPGYWSDASKISKEVFYPDRAKRTPRFYTNNQFGWMCTSGVPVKDQNGETVAFILADVSMTDFIKQMVAYLLQYALILLVLTYVLARFFVRYFERTLVDPIKRITQAAEAYAQDRRSGTDTVDHFNSETLNIHTGDEVENLSRVMEIMEQDLNEFEEDLTRITAERERIGTELSLATRIQADMLPHIFPAFPDRPEFDIHAIMSPAKEVGGDFYDYFLIDDDHLYMVIADVSGKGIPAALFMMSTMIILSSCAMLGQSTAEILKKTNESICSNNQEEMFVTVWVGVLEISTGKLRAANAGHEYPILKKPDGQFAQLKDKHGFVLGGMEGMTYRDYEIQLEPGTTLFLYTVGVPGATNREVDMFGTERLLAALNEEPEAQPRKLLFNVQQSVDDFVRDAPQFDDLTMLCLEYYGKDQEGADRED